MKVAQHREELRESTVAELQNKLAQEQKNLFMARKEAASKQLENPMKLRVAKKNIARILTIVRERELGSEKGKE
jgi:large subunit ribosomal protein L29